MIPVSLCSSVMLLHGIVIMLTVVLLWRNWPNPPNVIALASLSCRLPLYSPSNASVDCLKHSPSLTDPAPVTYHRPWPWRPQISPIHCSLCLARPLDWSNTRFILALTLCSTKTTWCLAREHAVALAIPTRQPHPRFLAPSNNP